jgi:hypothetical protein
MSLPACHVTLTFLMCSCKPFCHSEQCSRYPSEIAYIASDLVLDKVRPACFNFNVTRCLQLFCHQLSYASAPKFVSSRIGYGEQLPKIRFRWTFATVMTD